MYDNMPKILSRQSCLQLLMYYLICNYNPPIIIEIQILLIRQLIWVNELLKNIYCALMLDLRTDFSLPCKLIAEEHFLYDSIFTRI